MKILTIFLILAISLLIVSCSDNQLSGGAIVEEPAVEEEAPESSSAEPLPKTKVKYVCSDRTVVGHPDDCLPEETILPQPSDTYYQNTAQGTTLIINDYTFTEESTNYGRLKSLEFIIYNQEEIQPILIVEVIDQIDDTYTVKKNLNLDQFLEAGQNLHQTATLDLGIGAIQNPKEIKVHLTNDWVIITSVKFDTNLLVGFK